MNTGVLYYVWGNFNKTMLERSIASLRLHVHYPHHVHHDTSSLTGLSKKANMFDVSPFDNTLFLDIDTIIKGCLRYGFLMSEKYKLSCCIAPASSAYQAEPNAIREFMLPDLPQYNTGVIFFSKESRPVFKRWQQLCEKHTESAKNDQPYFSQAVFENLNPYILPRTWNFRKDIRYEAKIYHGPLKIVHARTDIELK